MTDPHGKIHCWRENFSPCIRATTRRSTATSPLLAAAIYYILAKESVAWVYRWCRLWQTFCPAACLSSFCALVNRFAANFDLSVLASASESDLFHMAPLISSPEVEKTEKELLNDCANSEYVGRRPSSSGRDTKRISQCIQSLSCTYMPLL